ncbi:MAG: MFS transporter [Chloroflexota bacterium]
MDTRTSAKAVSTSLPPFVNCPGSEPTLTVRRPRLFYGWYIVAASVATNFILSLAFFQGFQAFFLPIVSEFGWSRAFVSGALSLRQLEAGIMTPAIGFLVDRIGPRAVITTGIVIAGAGLVLLSFMNSELTFYLAFILTASGMSGASHGVAWPTVVANWFRRRRGRALGLTFLGPVFAGPLLVLVVLLEEMLGWRPALVVLGAGVWLAGIPLARVARSRPEDYGLLPDGELPGEGRSPAAGSPVMPAPAIHREPSGYTVKQAWRMGAFWLISVITAVQGLGVIGVNTHLLPFLQGAGFTAHEGAAGVGLVFLLSGVGRVGAGALTDYVDGRRVLAGVLLLQSFAYLYMLVMGPTFLEMFVFAFCYGAGFGSFIPLRPLMVRSMFGSQSFGAINGLIQGLSILPGVVGPVLMGALFDAQNTYAPGLVFFAVANMAVLPLCFLLPGSRPERRRATAITA